VKQLLQTAAVIGTEVSLPLLQAIAEAPDETLHRHLAHLQAAEFLYETRLFPEREYTFKHALTHEVAYGGLLLERRRVLHAHIVVALEALAGDRLTEQVERLAHHALRGEAWDKALAYCRQAGETAMGRSAHREAGRYFEQALAALQHLPEGQDTFAQAIDLQFALRNALHPLGAFERVLDHLCAAETLAEHLGDERRLGRIAADLTDYYRVMGRPDQAFASSQRALAIATALGDVALQIVAHYRLGQVCLAVGDYRRAAEVLRKNVVALEGEPIRERFGLPGLASVLSRTFLVRALAELGEFAEGRARGEEGLRIAEAVDHPFSLTQAYAGLGYLHLHKGDVTRAIALLERGLGVCQALPIPLLFPEVASALGYAYALTGRFAEALPLLEQAAEEAVAMRRMVEQAHRLIRLSDTYLLTMRTKDAKDRAEQGLVLSREHRERGHEAWALWHLGTLTMQRDPLAVEEVEGSYRQALTRADDLGMRPLQAHCHRGLGMLYITTGQQEPARTELSTAMKMYQDMEMTFWLPQTEAALEQVETQ
jgi:tetratricopeptide (TPR) repeat protein